MEEQRERLEDWADNRKKNMKDMPLKDKIAWYVTYYWVQMLLVAGVIFAAAYFIWFATVGKRETWLGGAFINADMDNDAFWAARDAFAAEYEVDTDHQLINIGTDYILDVENHNINQNNVNYYAKMDAMYAAGDLDFIAAGPNVFDYLLFSQYYFMNLEELLGAEYLAQFDEEDLYTMEDENGDSFVYGIAIEETAFAEQIDLMCEDAYVAVPHTAAHSENAELFIKYMLR